MQLLVIIVRYEVLIPYLRIKHTHTHTHTHSQTHVYIYIYIYIEREREMYTDQKLKKRWSKEKAFM